MFVGCIKALQFVEAFSLRLGKKLLKNKYKECVFKSRHASGHPEINKPINQEIKKLEPSRVAK